MTFPDGSVTADGGRWTLTRVERRGDPIRKARID
jgi:hypothetical protein